MIVKVQLSQSGNRGERVLIYDKRRKYMYEGQVTKEILEKMCIDDAHGLEAKLFFKAHLEKDAMVLDDYAKWQRW